MSPDKPNHPMEKPGAQQSFSPVAARMIKSRIFLVAATLLVAYSLCGFLLAPYLVERYVPRILPKYLECHVGIGEVRINPFWLTLEANDFSLTETNDTPVGQFDRLFLDFELSGLFRWAWTFKEFRLENPEVSLIMEPDGLFNLARLIPPAQPGEEAVDPKEMNGIDAAPPRFVIHNITLENGQIHVADHRQSEPAQVDIMPLNIHLERISTLPEHQGPYSLRADLDDGGILAWTGTITLHPLKSTGNIGFRDIRVGTLWKFMRDSLSLAKPEGRLDFNTDYALDLSGEAPRLTLNNLGLQLVDITLRLPDAESPFFNLADARLSGGRFDLASQMVGLENISIMNGAARVLLDENGTVNLQKIVRSSAETGDPVDPEDGIRKQATPKLDTPRPWIIALDAVDIDGMTVRFQDQGRLQGLTAGVGEFEAHFSMQGEAGGAETQLKVENIKSALREIEVSRPGDEKPIIHIPLTRLNEGSFDLNDLKFAASQVVLERGHVNVVRGPDGQLNLGVPQDSSQEGRDDSEPEHSAAGNPAFSYHLKNLDLMDFSTSIQDRTVKQEGTIVDLKNIDLKLANVSNLSPMAVYAGFDVGQGGRFTANGKVDPTIPSVRAEVDINDFSLTILQPYIDPHVLAGIRSGAFSTQGVLTYNDPDSTAEVAYDGKLGIAGLDITDSTNDDTLLGWRRLKASNLKFRLKPDLLEIPDVSLSELDGKFVVAEDGTTNVSRIVKTGKNEPEKQASPDVRRGMPQAGFPVILHSLRIENSRLFFADLSLRPQFATRIHDLDGVVIGASTKRDSRAQVELDGQVDDYGMAGIKGEINLFDPAVFTEIDMVFRNLEMNGMTPYSGKFVGRRIDAGKLSLDLKYRIEDGKLQGDNQIVVDSLKLGERIESKKAMYLPLDLAVALLEDENNIIDLDLPVKGDLEEPEFSYGHLVWKAFTNVIKKIVASPFNALGAMLGEDTEGLDVIEFENGAHEVPPPEKEKLHRLAQALNKRPNLRVTVQGRSSREADGFELKAFNVRRMITTGMGVELEADEDPGPLDYGNPRVQAMLESSYVRHYGNESLEQLKTSLSESSAHENSANKSEASAQGGKTGDPGYLSKVFYEKLVEVEPLEENVLIHLADTRAQAIVSEMIGVGKLSPERIATKAPVVLESPEAAATGLELEAM